MGMNFAECEKYIPMIFTTNLRPTLLGHTGIGKTEFWKQLAAKNRMDLIVIHVAQLEPSDFVGLYHVNEDKRTSNCAPNWLPYKDLAPEQYKQFEIGGENDCGMTLAELASEGYINPNGGIVFLDEVNRAHEDMRQALYQFLQDGKIHTYSLPKGDKTKLNPMGLPMGKYHIACAANPSGEGYETYEFDPALTNRLAWVNFTPDVEDSLKYLTGKYGRNAVTSWVDSHKEIVDFGDEFEIDNLLYSPRMFENHIKLYNVCRKEGKEFKRKVFETIMPKLKAQDFMAFLEEIEYVNYKDVMNGVSGDKEAKLNKAIDEKNMGVLSTITLDLCEFWKEHKIGETQTDLFKNEKNAIEHSISFLERVPQELIAAFLDGLGKSYDAPKNITKVKAFEDRVKSIIRKNRHVFE